MSEDGGGYPPLPDPTIATVFDKGDVKIHTFTSPDMFLGNSTHVIETADSLIVIDGQFVVPFAMAFRGFVNGLNKPIERLYLSHAHVDHFFGIGAAFDDVDVYADADTIAVLASSGEAMRQERAAAYGPMVADKVVVPQNVVAPGTETVSGLEVVAEVIHGAECGSALVLTLPELGVTVAQDMIYSGAHVSVVRDPCTWISSLEALAATPSELYLAGHGPSADKAEIAANIEYLNKATQTVASGASPEDFKAAMLATYPNRTGAAILDIYIPRLYGLEPEE